MKILSVIAKGLYRALFGPDSDEIATDCNSRRILSLFVAGVGGQISDGDQGIRCGCCAVVRKNSIGVAKQPIGTHDASRSGQVSR